jgi:pimeloyl-ACP methyl ester carboxylesterase
MLSRVKSIAIAVLLVGAGIYVLALAALFVFQRRLLFFPERLPPDFRFSSGEERWIGDLHTLFFRAPNSAGTIVYFHGNAGSLAGWGPLGADLARLTGFNVWMLDYPGYGKSKGGLPTEDGLHEAASAVYDAAVAEERGDEKRVVAFGRSIGTGLAVRLAAARDPGRLILESPYDSLVSLARALFPWAPGFLVRYPLRSDLDAPKVHCPTLILHGTEDEVIPFEQGRRLAGRIPGAIFVPIRGGHHNDLDSFEAWRKALALFLK